MSKPLRMPQVARVTIVGRTVHSIKITTAPTGTKIAKFSIACDSGFGEKKVSHFFDCVAFGKPAERIESSFVGHGLAVLIEGRLQQRKWQDKDGSNRSTVEIVVDFSHLLEWQDEKPARDEESPL